MIDEDPGWRSKRAMGDPRTTRWYTWSCEGRLPLFHREETRDAFVRAMLEAELEGTFLIRAFVVMPEHVHLLLAPRMPDGFAPAVAKFKACFARDTLRFWETDRPAALPAVTKRDGTRRFWLAGGGFDRVMRDADETAEKRDYAHANPLKRGLVERARDWRWSSADPGWRDRFGATGPGL